MTIGRVEINDRAYQKNKLRAVVVAQVVERLLLIPEIRSSNPVIAKIYIEHLLLTVLDRQK